MYAGTFLYAIYQRTQSESKSQLLGNRLARAWVCMQSIKEHNLKANHNCTGPAMLVTSSVCNLSKNTIWKQITTVFLTLFDNTSLYAIYQRTQSESKSQLCPTLYSIACLCMQSIKEHNLKANHNYIGSKAKRQQSVCNLSKNTIWKQITTGMEKGSVLAVLYAIYQRTQSESKSQLCHSVWCYCPVCMQSIKEHNLKANHNPYFKKQLLWNSVCNLSKNTIWKQITTQKRH